MCCRDVMNSLLAKRASYIHCIALVSSAAVSQRMLSLVFGGKPSIISFMQTTEIVAKITYVAHFHFVNEY